MIKYRPCGMCRELVPAETGCGHWRPGGKVEKPRKSRSAGYLARRRERDRINAAAARERAKQAIAEFRRQQGVDQETVQTVAAPGMRAPAGGAAALPQGQ